MISYGGVVLKEPSPQLAAWLLSYMPPSEIFSFYRPRWLGDTDLDPRSHFNWFLRRPVKVNTYYNPWGASRWGIGYFLTDSAGLTAIREQAYANDGYVALPLVMDDDIGGELETDLFMLPPIPLTAAPLDADDPAVQSYLLVLVDERYFWWERSATITVSSATWWADLYSAIGAALGETITTDTISTAYLVPNEELSRSYQYLPLLLDWVAESVGQRIVRTLAGAIVARSATSAADLVDTQVDEYVKIAGGTLPLSDDTQANVPATVSVVFPKIGSGSYALNITLASLALADYEDQFGRTGKHLIHSTANSQFLSYQTYIAVTANSDSPPPDNAEWLLQDGAAAAYAGGTTYSEGMLVTSSGDTYIYINATPSAGNAPPNATYWTLLPDGVNARGDWVTGAYAVGDSVQAPTNATQLLALAQQIATDFYLWRLASLEIRYRAVVPWVADGMHDIEWLHGTGGIVTVVSRSMWDAGIGRLQHAGAHNTESDNLGGEAIHIFADCTIDAGDVTVVTNSHIPSVIELTPAPAWSALASFDIDFGRRSFQPTGIVGTNADFLFEDFSSRTSTSCVIKTASGTAPEDSFGITIHGIISEEPEEGDPVDPLNPVDPTTPTITTNCCTEEAPNELCLQIGSIEIGDFTDTNADSIPDNLGVYLLQNQQSVIEGLQISMPLQYYIAGTGQAMWSGSRRIPGIGGYPYDFVFTFTLRCDPSLGGMTCTYNLSGNQNTGSSGNFTIDQSFVCNPFSFSGTAQVVGYNELTGLTETTDSTISISIVVAPCPDNGPGAPTVTFNDTTIVAADLEAADTFTIAGTGFETTAGNNVVTFNLGLEATCTTATSTLLTMTVTTAPTSAGALTAIVVNTNGTSAPAVQVRTVTFPPPITRTTKGTATGNGAQVSTLTKAAVTCEAGLLIVNVAIANNGTGPETITSVTYNGNAMTSAATKSNTGSPLALNLTSCVLTTYYLAVTDETGDIVVTLSGDSWVALEAVNVTGLADNLPDQTVTAKDTLSLPVVSTGTTTTSDEYVESACFVAIPTDDFWTWNGVTYGSQNVRLNKSFFLDSGYSILSSTGTVHATITDIVEAKAWLFVTVTFS